MAEHKRNAGASQPISRHPLFPAIVALWFGALFGLGSVIISPAVIERAVLATGLDRVIPMAAPPLGTTTRILMALAMTGLGGLIGALLGRRIARPAPSVHVRRRGAGTAAGDAVLDTESAVGDAAQSAPVRAAAPTGRRRALAIEEAPEPTVVDDRVPIPGQQPQILNVAEFDLDGFEDIAPSANANAAQHGDTVDSDDEPFTGPAWLEAEAAWHEPAPDVAVEPAAAFAAERQSARGAFVTPPPGAQIFAVPAAPADSLDDADDDAYGADDEASDRANDRAAPEPALQPFAQLSSEAPASGTAHEAPGNRLFETYSREIAARAEQAQRDRARPLFGAPANVSAGTAAVTVSANPEPGFNLLPRLHLGEWGEDEDEAEGFVTPLAEPAEAAEPEVADEGIEAPFVAIEDEAVEAVETAEIPEITASEPVAGSAAERISGAELDTLSQVELLERLALAMAQRREETRRAASAAVIPLSVAASTPAPIEIEAEHALNGTDVLHTDTTDVLVATETPDEAAIAPEAEAGEAEAEIAPLARFTFEAGAFAAPIALAPVEPAPEPIEPTPIEQTLAQPTLAQPEPVPFDPAEALPAALRPVAVDDDFDDAEPLPGYIPPRHIGLSMAADADGDHGPLGFGLPEDDDADGDGDAAVLEQGYSSLLNLSRQAAPRQQFVRIEEPEETGEVQPVVIFPGEEAGEPAPFARPAAAIVEPAPAVQPIAIAAPAPLPVQAPAQSAERLFDAPHQDAEETERALRAALATLQRMSGAA